jgi:uncharacterized protein YbbC (DUF1343 family)
MMNWLLFIIGFQMYLSFAIGGCTSVQAETPNTGIERITKHDGDSLEPDMIITGAERTALYYSKLKGKKIACVVNHTSVVGETHLVDTLLSMGIDVKVLFVPEHGFRGKAADGAVIKDGVDPKTGVPIVSLYGAFGADKQPSKEDLEDIELVIFDTQDVGVRCYTYISTMHYVMESCAANEIPFMVLDRPNPNGFYVDGPVLEKEFSSYIGIHKIPLVHGLTVGELAGMINEEGWLREGKKVDLTVIPCKNYTHDSFYKLPVKPSPNLPNARSVLLYPSLVFFEGTTVSIGRGTDKQFQVIGHPDIKHRSFMFTPLPNEGSTKPPQQGKVCYGENLQSLSIGSLMEAEKIRLEWIIDYYNSLKDLDTPFFLKTNYINKLTGTDAFQQQIKDGWTEEEIRDSWEPALSDYKKLRKKYLIYP